MSKIIDKMADIAADAAVGAVTNNLDHIIRVVMDSLFRNPKYPFIAGAQMCLIEHGMGPREAWDCAADTCNNFLKEEKVRFGQDGYGWGWKDGYDLALACEVEYWDDAA